MQVKAKIKKYKLKSTSTHLMLKSGQKITSLNNGKKLMNFLFAIATSKKNLKIRLTYSLRINSQAN
jgi:hypothetical protein